ncbi:oligopeptide/dipeptide ABC transporter, ATPase subunit [Haloterrigena turkmenica DSM 5511]|uniref:Oligopeptide/dipeptide ABC transporter, ATPase subunit n=1 Tax=Haloterrigena turkmenica (strain ATCC 51198 / DSM 5511 / JCM 9101 / NCIMB 13204 / VKM B-1734 / 4k) TaxID=543526 RepID=D2RXU0_HALTV|nr:oligopeptide/dipeptide ABC transporter ATP-binding protein [Haloterrigena turkmenica]ADB59774.1 oligopeptide/dipeptide ABC transporter, ATPase subunit [Haloterrigena turkmenica DSM 5511]
MSNEPLLRVEGLEKEYVTADGVLDRLLGNERTIRAVDGVDLEIREGETLGLVGESGCGKSSLARSLLRLTEPTAGTVSYRGTDLTACSRSELRAVRTDVQYVPQNPGASLNPRLTVGDTIGEPLEVHDVVPPSERDARVRNLLETVGLAPGHAERYPHEFSGGQQQRIAIARALAVEPELVVCDEPVSSLDVSVQAQLCNLLADLQDEFGLAYLFIAHDLSIVAHVADRVAVMYLGKIVDVGPTEAVFDDPSHPYTAALRSAIPEPDPRWEGDRIVLEGAVPSPGDCPSGCRFHTRCPSVLPPAEYDLESDAIRGILRLRRRLADAEDGLESVLATSVADEDVPAAIRDAFDIPTELRDDDADRVLADALEAIAAGDIADGRARLASAFATPCETDRPRLEPVDGGDGDRSIACHRFDDAYADHLPDDPETETPHR